VASRGMDLLGEEEPMRSQEPALITALKAKYPNDRNLISRLQNLRVAQKVKRPASLPDGRQVLSMSDDQRTALRGEIDFAIQWLEWERNKGMGFG
jgi:hypothetical protein